MDVHQSIFAAVALSGPISILIGIGRGVMCLDRSIRVKATKSAIASGATMLTLLVLLAILIGVWFVYGVAHTGKDATTDAVVLASTVLPAYVMVFCAWRVYGYLERRFRRIDL